MFSLLNLCRRYQITIGRYASKTWSKTFPTVFLATAESEFLSTPPKDTSCFGSTLSSIISTQPLNDHVYVFLLQYSA